MPQHPINRPMTTPKLTLEPTVENVAAQIRKFDGLGRELYIIGPRSDGHKTALLAERRRIRDWLREFAPGSLIVPQETTQ